MHPVVAPLVAEVGFRLRDLIGVVREGVVDAAAVDVQILAEVLHRDAGALDVPAGVADAPRGIPLERLILELRLRKPQDEVVLVALVAVLLDALAHADREVFLVEVVENIIFLELGGVKIHVAAGKIGVAGVHELGDYLDVLVDAVRRRLDDVRRLDVEFGAVGEERVGIEFRDLHDGLVLALCALEHLVLAFVGVRGQVADVGNVHNALDVIAEVAQVLLENVLHDVGAEIADMREMIHGRATGIHLHYIGMIRHELLALSGCRIIKLHMSSQNMSRMSFENVAVCDKVFHAGIDGCDDDENIAHKVDHGVLLAEHQYRAEADHRAAGFYLAGARGGDDAALLHGDEPQTGHRKLAEQHYRDCPAGHLAVLNEEAHRRQHQHFISQRVNELAEV